MDYTKENDFLNKKVIFENYSNGVTVKCTLREALKRARIATIKWTLDPIYTGVNADELYDYCLLTKDFGDICAIYPAEEN